MENEITTGSPDRKKLYVFLLALFAVVVLYCGIMFILSPLQKLKKEDKEFRTRNEELLKTDDRILFDSAYIKLLEEKNFLQSRIMMAETDSIYLTINLSDSTANIEIAGVVVHTARIHRTKISKILSGADDYLTLSMLSAPLTIKRNYATVEKEPVSFKMAPKDTSEYKPDLAPDTTDIKPVNCILEMQNGMRLFLYQTEKNSSGDKRSRFFFNLACLFRNSWKDLKCVAAFRVPEYEPFIKLRMNRADIKIIYRALPKNGQVAVHR